MLIGRFGRGKGLKRIYKVECSVRISRNAQCGFPPLVKTGSPRMKDFDNFSRVFEMANQLLTRHSLYLAT